VNTILKNTDDLKSFISKLKSENKKIVFTNGVFDILHRGHVEYLNEAKKLGEVLIVGLNSDSSVKKIKGKNRPIMNEGDRAYTLSNLKPVDYVVIFEEESPYNLIKKILPDFLVKGGDWKTDEIIGSDIVRESGGKVLSIKYLENYSTSSIIKKIKEP
jgi:rfaE bifunctional protein nucleotidyltransferase chain/domain